MHNRAVPRDMPTSTIEGGSIDENACAVTVHMRQYGADLRRWGCQWRGTWQSGGRRLGHSGHATGAPAPPWGHSCLWPIFLYMCVTVLHTCTERSTGGQGTGGGFRQCVLSRGPSCSPLVDLPTSDNGEYVNQARHEPLPLLITRHTAPTVRVGAGQRPLGG